jgi:ATP-dependent RNA helicase DDX46/PRP5
MVRRDRSYSPDTSNKRVRQSHRSPRSPSPTRRNIQRPSRRYDDERDNKERDRPRDRDRERDKDRYRDDRYRDDRHRDDRRRDSYRDDRRDDRRRSRSTERKDRDRRPLSPPLKPQAAAGATQTPPPEDEKLKAKRAKLEAWKKDREAKKALDEAKVKAMALAGKSAPGEHIFNFTCTS